MFWTMLTLQSRVVTKICATTVVCRCSSAKKKKKKKNASCLPFSKFYPHNDLKKKKSDTKKVTSNFIYCTHIYTHANAHTLNELHCQKTSHTSTSTCDVLLIITLPFIFASDIYHCQFYILEGSHDALHSYDLRII